MKSTLVILAGALLLVAAAFFFFRGDQFELPQGKTQPFISQETTEATMKENDTTTGGGTTNRTPADSQRTSSREIFVTDGVKHSIPLGEILSGGPPKDGIPSIDNPKFIDPVEGNAFYANDDIGLGVVVNGDARFYPYQVLVWHEIVNDTVGGEPLLVTYCPLCATGIVFERRVDGEVQEFGVSGRLWQSNLLMYNRAAREDDESLWSQVLGEAVLGPNTGERLAIVRSDTVSWGDWKKLYPDTKVLSRDTGALRSYGLDPYGDYYTNESVSFGATFNDDRLHPKAFVLGVEIDGTFKAYHREALPVGETTDTFAGKEIRIEKTEEGAITMTASGEPLPYVGGFWFSWLAVHPETELFK
ncbi:MAG: DUF3179 domain-containing protein [Candidatus Paceibacteria bacterium]